MAVAAIQATFSDFRLVRSRKVAQLVFEVPIEGADDALAKLGGLPQPAAERWCGIARLVAPAADKPKQSPYAERGPGEQAVTRAGILCSDEAFQAWLGATDSDGAAQMVRDYCGVTSRSEIGSNVEALDKFLQLEGDWKRRVPHANGAAR